VFSFSSERRRDMCKCKPRFERDLPPEVCPRLVGDYYREPGQTFAQAWRAHIESTLNPEISGDTAEDPTLFIVY
jgi:hypothetical protein